MAYINCTNRTRLLFLECRRLMVLLMHSCCSGGRVLNNSIKPTTDWAGCGGGQSVKCSGTSQQFTWLGRQCHHILFGTLQVYPWCNLYYGATYLFLFCQTGRFYGNATSYSRVRPVVRKILFTWIIGNFLRLAVLPQKLCIL